jgi:hypothetical protein
MSRWATSLRVWDLGSERASQGEACLTGSTLGLAGQPALHCQLVTASQFVRLSQARGHLCTCQIFVHELHLVAPVLVSVHGGEGFRFLVGCVRPESGSQRAGEGEAGLKGGALGTAGLPLGASDEVPAAQAFGLTEALGVLHPGHGLVYV